MGLLRKLSPRARKVFDWVIGLTLIGIGIIGLFVPILQGLVFILAGLAVLSSHSRWARAIYDPLKARVKRVSHGVRERVERRRREKQEKATKGKRDGKPAP